MSSLPLSFNTPYPTTEHHTPPPSLELGLAELRQRAFQHIVKSLTVANVPYEVFSSFSAAFEEVRKVQVDYFLANWSEIKTSEAMRNVFTQIRMGRHPGFGTCFLLVLAVLFFLASGNWLTDERDVLVLGVFYRGSVAADHCQLGVSTSTSERVQRRWHERHQHVLVVTFEPLIFCIFLSF